MLITLFWLLDTEPKAELITGFARIHGVVAGVIPAISRFKRVLTCVLFLHAMLFLTYDEKIDKLNFKFMSSFIF